jgi:drug/metabolite transporter (DMT)-like permease
VTHIFLYLLALFTLSQSAAFAKWAAVPPDVIGFWRLLIASLLVLPWAYFKSDLRRQWKENPSHRKWVFLTGFFFFGHLWTFVYAAQHTLISHTMIIFATNPLMVALGQWWLTKEAPPRRTIAAYLLALISLFVLFQQSRISVEGGQMSGDVSALISALLFSIYILLSKKSREVFHNSVFTSIMYLSATLCFAVNLIISGHPWWGYSLQAWEGIGCQIIFSTLLGHSLIAYLMRHLNVTLMTTGKLAEPVLATIVASFMFGEPFSAAVGISFALTAFSIVILFWS